MAAYVDPIRHYPSARWRSKHWCHLTADTREELHALADRIGLRRESFQDHTYRWHYDLVPESCAVAVESAPARSHPATWSATCAPA